jgi:hypothetical protein
MRKLDAFMTGFASVFTGIAGCLMMFVGVIGQTFAKTSRAKTSGTSSSNNLSKQTKIDYFDGFKKDREALASDWGKIGGDFRRAIDQYVETNEGTTSPNI